MNAPELPRPAYVIEGFINAQRFYDCPARTDIKIWLVNWPAGVAAAKAATRKKNRSAQQQ